MARENLEIVRSILAAWGRGDYGSVDWAHREIEFTITDGPQPGSWIGLAGMAEWGEFLNAWEDVHTEAEEYRELDGERVLVLVRTSGRGKTSGLELGEMWTESAILFHLRDGEVTRLVLYWERKRAVVDLGLAPEAN